jgi:hypothetical protein
MQASTNLLQDLDGLLRLERVLNGILSGSKNISPCEVAVLLAHLQQYIVASVPIEKLPVYLQWTAAEAESDFAGHLPATHVSETRREKASPRKRELAAMVA